MVQKNSTYRYSDSPELAAYHRVPPEPTPDTSLPAPAASDPLITGLRVGEEIRQWEEGSALLFDDSFEHEVWWRWRARSPTDNGTVVEPGTTSQQGEAKEAEADQPRVVLIVDVFHPQLPPEERAKVESQMAELTMGADLRVCFHVIGNVCM